MSLSSAWQLATAGSASMLSSKPYPTSSTIWPITFVARLNRGLVESLNTKIKTIFRRGDGIRNVVHIFQRLDLDIEGYRRLA